MCIVKMFRSLNETRLALKIDMVVCIFPHSGRNHIDKNIIRGSVGAGNLRDEVVWTTGVVGSYARIERRCDVFILDK